jgi:hypothetical protein
VWLFENMHTRNKSSAVTFLNMLDSSTMIVFGLYVLFISRNWFYLELTMYLCGLAAFLFVLAVMPESPKWLLINGRPKEALEQFKTIAQINGVPYTIS